MNNAHSAVADLRNMSQITEEQLFHYLTCAVIRGYTIRKYSCISVRMYTYNFKTASSGDRCMFLPTVFLSCVN